MLKRIIKILGVVLLLTVLGGATSIYLLQQNRNLILNYLTDQLQEYSGIEINIANTSIGFRQGITLDMHDIQARSESGTFDLKAPKAHLRVELLPLLQGEFVSSRAELRAPQITWAPGTGEGSGDNGVATSTSGLLQTLEINTGTLSSLLSTWRHILCTNASLKISLKGQEPLQFRHANLSLKQLEAENRLLADLSGEMHSSVQDEPMRLHMQTRLSVPPSESSIPLARVNSNTSVHLSSINIAEVNEYLPDSWSDIKLQGNIELEASSKGSFAQGLDLSGRIFSKATEKEQTHLRVNYNGTTFKPGNIELGCTFKYLRAGNSEISALKLNSPAVRIRGELHLASEKSHAEISLSSAPITYTQLRLWITSIPPAWNKRLQGATITCNALRYSGPLDSFQPLGIKSSQWRIELPNLIPTEYAGKKNNPIQLHVDHSGTSVLISSSILEWNTHNFSAKTKLDAQGKWDTQNENLEVSLDLSESEIHAAGTQIKAASSPARLTFKLQPHSQGWEIYAAALASEEVNATFNATAKSISEFSADIVLTHFDLDAFRKRVPILDLMELGGNIDLKYSLQRKDSNWRGKGTLSLHDGSIYPAQILGRIHHINGTANIEGFELHAPDIDLQLGRDASAMHASVSIADLRRPVADIHASGDEVVANDLIFDSRTALLHNLEGHIRIHAEGIDFLSSQVDLKHGTHAEVRGSLGFSTPDLDLDIHATYADIDEVIALWSAEEDNGSENGRSNGSKIPTILDADETMFIDAMVDKGIFSGFAFQEAEGRINIREKQLRIAPLSFRADRGNGKGTIVVSTTSPPYLRINGALDDIDADKVYTQIFEDLGLLTGTLDGTFSLHGPIGSNFSANADGIFRVDIRNGVLRKFKFLSKAFSLLNVAQLFKMQLPNMASEGMPFKHLSADLNMENGVLDTDNLLIHSEAMNLALAGEFSLPSMRIDAEMALNPLGTVDSIFSKIPVAGWLLTGEKKTFITVEFDITGPAREPIVSMKPLSSVSNQMFGILKRTLTLPGTTITDPGKVFFHQGKKKQGSEDEAKAKP